MSHDRSKCCAARVEIVLLRTNNIWGEQSVYGCLNCGKLYVVRTYLEQPEVLSAKGCQCVCHDYPEHGKLQDALEALKWHQDKLKSEVKPC